MKLAAVRVLAFPSVDHDMGFFGIISFHYAGNPVTVFEALATDGTGGFLPITHNEKHRVPRCKQDRNLLR